MKVQPDLKKLKHIVGTKLFVIFGYSLPFLNREIYKSLLHDLDLEKIYFQTIHNEITKMIESFMAINDIRSESILPIGQVNQFHIPILIQ